jgi:8-hydroxy-5-deazaflavin:NADPH oxidoreductase
MRIAILGFGNVGAQLGKLWSASGHVISAGLRPGGKGTEVAKGLGIAVATPEAAIRQAEVIALAVPWAAAQSALASLGPVDGKIIVDATNPLASDLSVIIPQAGSAGVQVAEWAKGARVVKAFNTIGAMLFGDSAFDMLYCGDDAEAKKTVRALIADTTMNPVDVGPLKNAGYLEQMAGLWVDLEIKQRVPGAFGFRLVFKN